MKNTLSSVRVKAFPLLIATDKKANLARILPIITSPKCNLIKMIRIVEVIWFFRGSSPVQSREYHQPFTNTRARNDELRRWTFNTKQEYRLPEVGIRWIITVENYAGPSTFFSEPHKSPRTTRVSDTSYESSDVT